MEKNHVPNHQPVVVFSTVVDHSGSMNTIRQTNDRELTVEYMGPWIQMRSGVVLGHAPANSKRMRQFQV